MSAKIVVCDDTVTDFTALSGALYVYDTSFDISAFSSGEALPSACAKTKPAFALIYLDIFMPGIDGIETSQRLGQYVYDIKVAINITKKHLKHAKDKYLSYLSSDIKRGKLI